MFDIGQELKKLPDKPGVYIMKDSYGGILYIGKASVLRNRVRQYFQASSNLTPRIRTMVSKIESFEYIVTNSEVEALVLECNLIKEHKPRFNVLLKDDKSYPYIKVTINEEFPKIFMTRKILKDGARYIGPYTDVSAVKETLAFLKKIFPLKQCNKELPRDCFKERPCLNFHIGQCLAPCQGKISAVNYKQMIEEVCSFLDGRQDDVIERLEKDMDKAAENMEYERAAVLRDRIGAARKLSDKQKVAETGKGDADIDVIGLAQGANDACIQVFFVRNGKLVGRENFMFRGMTGVEDGEIIASFLKQFYGWAKHIPKQVLIGIPVDEAEVIEQWLSDKRRSRVEIRVPQKGDRKNLLQMAQKNAEIELHRHGLGYDSALIQLKEIMELEVPVKRIEAFDISNLSGTAVVGSMIVFDGRLDRRQYRRFRIKSVKGQNDVGCMSEIISRRVRRAMNDDSGKQADKKFGKLPDIFLVDGGYAQTSAVTAVTTQLGISVPAAGMVKDKKHKTRGLVLPDGREVDLKKYPQLLKLVSEIQEEVHRFAVEYHRKLRKRELISSVLDGIRGIGDSRKRMLFKHFGSLEAIQHATIEELAQVKGMNIKTAESVYYYFH